MSLDQPHGSDITLSHPRINDIYKIEDAIERAFELERVAAQKSAEFVISAWQYAEMLYLVQKDKAWKNLTDEDGNEYESFVDYVDRCPHYPFLANWGYVLVGCHKHYRVKLNIEQDQALVEQMITIGFDKLYLIRKVVTNLDTAAEWFDIAAVTNDLDELREIIRTRGAKSNVIKSDKRQRRWRSPVVHKADLPPDIADLIEEFDTIPEDATIRVIAQIVEWGDDA